MNRIKTIALVAVFLLLSGCAKAEAKKAEPEPQNVSRFVVIEEAMIWDVVADRHTGVMYAVSRGGYNHGNFTLLVDAEGKPLIWKGENDEVN